MMRNKENGKFSRDSQDIFDSFLNEVTHLLPYLVPSKYNKNINEELHTCILKTAQIS